jgi:chromosome segregation ATPase
MEQQRNSNAFGCSMRGEPVMKLGRSAYRRASAAIVFGLCLASLAVAQDAKAGDNRDTMQQLLTEVRMLRQAFEAVQRISVDTYRSQLLVDRIRASREEVRRLTASVNDARETLRRTQLTIPTFTEEVKMQETQLQLEVDQLKRAQREFELKRSKEMLENYKSEIEPLKEREQQLQGELNKEKAQLGELEGRLDLLERAIENDRQKLDKDASKTKTP